MNATIAQDNYMKRGSKKRCSTDTRIESKESNGRSVEYKDRRKTHDQINIVSKLPMDSSAEREREREREREIADVEDNYY